MNSRQPITPRARNGMSPTPAIMESSTVGYPPPPVDYSGARGEPMQLGPTSLNPERRDRRYGKHLGAYCTFPKHQRTRSMGELSPGPLVISSTLPSVSHSIVQTHIQLGHKQMTALVDSGEAVNFIEHE